MPQGIYPALDCAYNIYRRYMPRTLIGTRLNCLSPTDCRVLLLSERLGSGDGNRKAGVQQAERGQAASSGITGRPPPDGNGPGQVGGLDPGSVRRVPDLHFAPARAHQFIQIAAARRALKTKRGCSRACTLEAGELGRIQPSSPDPRFQATQFVLGKVGTNGSLNNHVPDRGSIRPPPSIALNLNRIPVGERARISRLRRRKQVNW